MLAYATIVVHISADGAVSLHERLDHKKSENLAGGPQVDQAGPTAPVWSGRAGEVHLLPPGLGHGKDRQPLRKENIQQNRDRQPYDCGRRLGRSGRHGISAGYVPQDTAGAARAGAVEGSRAQLVGAEQQPAASQDETHLDITAEEAAADARTSASLLFSAAAVGDMDVVADAAAAGLPHGAAAHPPATAHRGLQTHTHRTHGHAYSRTAVRIPNSIRESAQVSA
jgi:hypothetical protein